ncbi:MAG: response regulator transcription factor [Gammaproteobacteria bacterium]|nr:MAG: response regulator transcription factor [Gammaproteobacteria bacterium]
MNDNAVVHIVDDDESVRKSLRWLIESIGLSVTCYGSASEFEESYQSAGAECLVLDVRMPGMSGLDLQERLISNQMTLPVILVTGHADVPMAIRAMKNGAFDFIEKPYNDQHLLDRVQEAIHYDELYKSKSIDRDEIRERLASLTKREREVLERVIEGSSNKEIAADLVLSVKTVETHRSNLMSKMEADSLPKLIRLVIQAENSG